MKMTSFDTASAFMYCLLLSDPSLLVQGTLLEIPVLSPMWLYAVQKLDPQIVRLVSIDA